MDMNMVIVNNILGFMKERCVKQIDLANSLSISKQTMSKMLSGERTINAVELSQIANALEVSIGELVKKENPTGNGMPVLAFMGEVSSPEAKEGIRIADELSEMICFHLRCKKNGEETMSSWSK